MTVEQFWSKVDKSNGPCWTWTGYLHPQGYGYANFDGKTWRAHRLAWTMLRGAIPPGLTIDHLCRNRACVNPAHLEPVTNRVNVLRGVGITAQCATKTHCAHGHPLAGDNLRIKSGGERACRACHRIHNSASKKRKRAARRLASHPTPEPKEPTP